MSKFLIVTLLLVQVLALQVFAVTDEVPKKSPCGKFSIINFGNTATDDHYFELRRSDGRVLTSYRDHQGDRMPSFAEDIAWSPRQEYVALSVRTGKYIYTTWVISTSSGKFTELVAEDWDSQTRPIRWTRRGELVVETRAPFGGKYYEGDEWNHLRFRRTFRIKDDGARADCVYVGPVVYPYRAQMIAEGFKPTRR